MLFSLMRRKMAFSDSETLSGKPLAPAGSRRFRLCYEYTRSTRASLFVLAVLFLSVGTILRSKTQLFLLKWDVLFQSPVPSDSDNIPDERLNATERALHVNHVENSKQLLKVSENIILGASELVDLPFLDSGSLTAILPVTEKSVDRMQHIVEPLISEQSSIFAVTLVCPSELVAIINGTFRGGHIDTFLDISISIWSEGLDEGAAVMRAAAEVTTEYALIMSSEGLGDLDEGSRDGLLSHPFLLDFPTGVCGGLFTEIPDHAVCVLPRSESQIASFLVPPFVLPSSLVRGFNSSTKRSQNLWSDFGATFSHRNGAGAFVQETKKEDSDKVWCRNQCQKFGLIVDDPTLVQCSTTASGTDASEGLLSDPAHSSSLAIILPTLGDLRIFSPVACSFIRNGYKVHVLILLYDFEHTAIRDSSFPWLHDQFISDVCDISISALHSSSNDHANAEAVRFWLKSANEAMSVIIFGTHDTQYASMLAFETELEMRSSVGTTVIKIPKDDLAYCDWIGSLSLAELRNWHIPDVEITVITDDRPKSLMRLLKSMEGARYFGDSVNVRINMEQTADLETRRRVDKFHWDHGSVFIHHRVVHAGLLTAIVESWYPRSNESYGIILEDDVEVSPLFYAWTKMALLRYRHGLPENKLSSLFGISLYQQKQIELRPEGRRPFDAQTLFDSYGLLYRNTPYLSPIPCSWGAVYFPEHWREFHSYLMVRFSEAWLPLHEHVVPHVRSNRWAKSWKRFFIELVFLRGYVMLYPNYDDFVSLSTNHLEIGSHVREQPRSIYDQKKALFTLPLMAPSGNATGSNKTLRTGLLNLPEEQMPAWSDLPVLDLLGGLSSEQELEERGSDRQKELLGCTTVGSQAERRRPFQAEELFTCIAEHEEEENDDFDSMDVHYDF